MDIDKLERTYHLLLEYMKNSKMTDDSCKYTENMVKDLISHKGEYDSYPQYFEKFIDSSGIYPRSKHFNVQKTTLRRIWAFEEYDHLPDKLRFQPVIASVDRFALLPENFKNVVIIYDECMKNCQLEPTTLYSYRSLLVMFLYEMSLQGASNTEDITPLMVSSFFNKDGKWVRGNSLARNLKNIFRKVSKTYPCLKELCKFIPIRKDVVNIHGIIPEETVQKAKELIFGEDSTISLRDKAILTIAIFTGMRGTDIAKLSLDNLDWYNDCIRIVQSKTEARLTLPLLPGVGNIIYDYIMNERPNSTESRMLFFNYKNIEKEFTGRIVTQIVNGFFASLGIDGKERNRGLRALRHRLASALLSKGTEPAVVSSILGHITPKSLNHYADVDLEDLRRCALDVSMYKINDDVFK